MAETEPRQISIDGPESTTALIYAAQSIAHGAAKGATAAAATLILAHGAGAGQRHPFMTTFARGLTQRGLDVVTFDFIYMHRRRRVPDRMPQLIACYRSVISAAREQLESARHTLVIGGKSMGGRAATHVAAEDAELPVRGIVLLGYPLHPPGRPDQMRDAHLPSIRPPMLFIQGSRDVFGTPEELRPVLQKVTPAATLHVVEGGDHSFKLGGRDATRQSELYDRIQRTITDWIASLKTNN
jgi:predicted alpha/beta-hydrolase family hydrolase